MPNSIIVLIKRQELHRRWMDSVIGLEGVSERANGREPRKSYTTTVRGYTNTCPGHFDHKCLALRDWCSETVSITCDVPQWQIYRGWGNRPPTGWKNRILTLWRSWGAIAPQSAFCSIIYPWRAHDEIPKFHDFSWFLRVVSPSQ